MDFVPKLLHLKILSQIVGLTTSFQTINLIILPQNVSTEIHCIRLCKITNAQNGHRRQEITGVVYRALLSLIYTYWIILVAINDYHLLSLVRPMTWDPTHLRWCCSKTPYLSTTKPQPKLSYSPHRFPCVVATERSCLATKTSCCYGGATSAEVHCRLWLGSWWCTHSDHYFSQNLGGFVVWWFQTWIPWRIYGLNFYLLLTLNISKMWVNIGYMDPVGINYRVNLVVWVRGWFGIQIRVPLYKYQSFVLELEIEKTRDQHPPQKKRAAESSPPPISFCFPVG